MIGTFGAAAPMMIFNVPLAVPPDVFAEIVTVNVPAAAGVPEMMPVEEFKVSPAGMPDAEYELGERVAVIA